MLCCRLGETFRVLGEQALAVSRSGGERRELGIVTGEGAGHTHPAVGLEPGADLADQSCDRSASG